MLRNMLSRPVHVGLVVVLLLGIVIPVVPMWSACPSPCRCDDETLEVVCGDGLLDVLPIVLNPSLQRLTIRNNKIRSLDSSIQFYPALKFLDLSYNHVFNMPPKTFFYQRELTELHLNHNKVGSISNKTFTGLESLTILNLRGNFLDELTDGVFADLKKLEELNLGQNRIGKIDQKAFEGLVNLKVLYLDDNTLSAVPSTAFGPLVVLAELYLGINSFSTIAKDAFMQLDKLSRLDLRGAALVNVTRETFNGLDALRVLDLSDNRLSRIPTSELSALERLEELSLGQNDFDSIPMGAFAGLANLRKIDISGSLKLNRIESGAFSANANLEGIVIASNKALAEIQDGALSGLPHLKRLMLKDNALTTLSDGLFTWNELIDLDLSENPIACDCRILWLRNVLVNKSNSSQNQNPVVCASPDRLREQTLQALSPELLGCSHTNPQEQAIICVILVAAAAIITTLALVIYKCRRRIREAVKGRWGNSAIGRKEREYQKTFSEEDYMGRLPNPCGMTGVHTTTLNNYQINNHHSHGIRHIPVTEL